MALEKDDVLERLHFICGKWRVDFLVNFFSNDLAHIPATEFKSEDGRDFSAITFEFTEDYNMVMRDESTGKEVPGTWEMIDSFLYEFRYTLNEFLEIPEGAFKDNVEKLSVQDGYLCFTLGFLTIAMKKFEEGVVTEEPDIGDIEPSPEDEKLMEIVGEYEVYKCLSMVGDDFGLFTKDEIKAALEAGEVEDVRDGLFSMGSKPWKAVGGKYYYDTGETREVFGKEQSSWDELAFDEEGNLPFGSGFMLLRRI